MLVAAGEMIELLRIVRTFYMKLIDVLAHDGILLPTADQQPAGDTAQDGQRDIEAHGQLADDALAVPVRGYIGNPPANGFRYGKLFERGISHADSPKRMGT